MKELISHYSSHPKLKKIEKQIQANPKLKLGIKGLSGSVQNLLISSLNFDKRSLFYICDDKETAAYTYNDLQNLNPKYKILFFPSSYKRSIQYGVEDKENTIMRTECLNYISKLKLGKRKTPFIIVTYPEAVFEKVITEENLSKNTLNLKVGESVSIDFVNDVLYEYDFERVDFVYEPGQFAVRGSIIDIFSFANEDPYRVDFFGDDVESIRSFDIETQLSKEKLEDISIIPNIAEKQTQMVNVFQFFESNTSIIFQNLPLVKERIANINQSGLFESIEKDYQPEERNNYVISEKEFTEASNDFMNLYLNYVPKEIESIEFETKPQPRFNKNFDLLGDDLQKNKYNQYNIYILSDSKKQINRLNAIFEDTKRELEFETILKTLHEGFIDKEIGLCVYTDHQIFDRYHRFKLRDNKGKNASITLKEINSLQQGDYVVHVDHGIGKFGGLQKLNVEGNEQEVIRLVYKDNDVLFVNIHSLHKISKYKSKDGDPPRVYKLGTGTWAKVKAKTKSKVKDIAKELIALYAKRKQEMGFAFTPDSYLQQELEASFLYEDTPDQEKATAAVKQGMESEHPMDHLVCGDVGFGKTEIAIRAAFKAATDGKQVAVLVPTTILALQHYKTFSERLKNFPVNIDYVSRMRTTGKINKTLKAAKEGDIDILIGTHRIVSKDIAFKDLGLLIIDEEQKFGVSVKEKLKAIKANVDTLTLTATPIPRTLQFSLMGARDLSIINTPPPNRYPIVTELHVFNEEIIKEAIDYELERNGQVFFINNRVQNIAEVEKLINRVSPQARTVIAHGQMEGPKLEKIMLDFINHEYDILIATTIIESGLDIPNANTIIVNNAQNFGLSELHQLRGRVGRSNKKAFAYLLAPPLSSVSTEARRRLKAIEEFSELGSGFNIALQDLDIRGAGNLLGGEQSGFISDIGYETYQRILNEAIQELREEEFKDLFNEPEKVASQHLGKSFVTDCVIDTDLSLLFPDNYINNISERVRLYKELDNIDNEKDLSAFEQRLIDRFGDLPEESSELLNAVRFRWLAQRCGIEKILLKKNKLIAHFIANQNSLFYKTEDFQQIIMYIASNPKKFAMKESKEKLSMSAANVKNISQAMDLFKAFPV